MDTNLMIENINFLKIFFMMKDLQCRFHNGACIEIIVM